MIDHPEFRQPPREFSLCPFWFWNDRLDRDEIVRQMADFRAHGVYAFVIHPRVGLPRDLGWMSDALLDFVRFAVEEAARTGMWVVLYDEGMYPSGSSCGQVVAENPAYACRGLARRPVGSAAGPDEDVLWSDGVTEIVERPIRSVIRGLHYIGQGPEEDTPPAADLLNPDAVACFLRHVYDGYFAAVGDHFGTTVRGIFTDEPSLLGRPQEPDLIPAPRDLLRVIPDLRPDDLPKLWDPESPERARYDRALRERLEVTYYGQLSAWCRAHGVALMGHPEPPDELGVLRHFDIPGQDLVWRWVLPGPTAVEGPQSTQAKAAASAMFHAKQRRNANELAGAYGHELTLAEFQWLIHWCAVRGTNLFVPHAFYYSTRGIRRDERPPDVGPHSPWWETFADLANAAARLAWLNTDCEPEVAVAILERDGRTPWRAARCLFENQIDFHYATAAEVDRYAAVVLDGPPDEAYPDALAFETPHFLENLLARVPRTFPIEAHPDLRVRRVHKAGCDVVMLHNEGELTLRLNLCDPGWTAVDLTSPATTPVGSILEFHPFELKVLFRPR